jgi:hypothetical protein
VGLTSLVYRMPYSEPISTRTVNLIERGSAFKDR